MTTQLTLQTTNFVVYFGFFGRTMVAPSGTTRKAPTARATFGRVDHIVVSVATRTTFSAIETTIGTCIARTTITNFIRTVFHTIATATSVVQIVTLVVATIATTVFHTVAISLRYSVFDIMRKTVLLFVIFQ